MSSSTATISSSKQRHLAGTGHLVRLFLRRDRLRFPLWVAGFGLFVVYIGNAVPAIAPNKDELRSLAVLFTQPIGRMFTGPAYGMDDPSYERFFATGYAPYLFVMAALMSILLVTRHTRGEEQAGRAELIRANVTGRHAPLTAALTVAVISNVVAGVVVTVMGAAVGFAFLGSFVIGVGTAITGMLFAGCAAVTAQLSEFSRAASGLAGLVLGASFAVRALGDMVAVGGSGLSWVSPLAWPAQMAPYVLNRWAPLGLSVVVTLVLLVTAYVLSGRRDFEASLISVRPGAVRANRFLGSPWGLAMRIQRSTFFGWGVGVALLGVVDGAFMQALLDAGQDMPPTFQDIFGATELGYGYISFIGLFTSVLVAAFTASAMQVPRDEEVEGRADLILATPTSRYSWLAAHTVTVMFGATLITVVTGIGAGVAVAASTGNWGFFGDTVAAHVGLLPAVLLMTGLWSVFMGWIPRLLSPFSWIFVGFTGLTAVFADLLDIPDAVMVLSPFEHLANIPQDDFSVTPIIVLLALAVLTSVIGLAGIKRREISTT